MWVILGSNQYQRWFIHYHVITGETLDENDAAVRSILAMRKIRSILPRMHRESDNMAESETEILTLNIEKSLILLEHTKERLYMVLEQ